MKEMRDYLKLFKKYFWLFGLLVVLAVSAVFLYQQTQKGRYQVVTSLYVNRAPEPRSDKYYTYEGYYAQLVSKDYTDVAVALLNSPDFTHLAGEKAKLASDPKVSTQVRKVGPQLISLTVGAGSGEAVRKLTQSLIDNLNDRSKSSQNLGADITLVNPDLSIGPKPFNTGLYLGIGVFGALLASILIAVIREYLLA